MTITLETTHGKSIFGMARAGGAIQINVFAPAAGGAALFDVYPDGYTDEQIKKEVAELLEQGPLTPGIIDSLPGAMASGAVAQPTFTLGIPTVESPAGA